MRPPFDFSSLCRWALLPLLLAGCQLPWRASRPARPPATLPPRINPVPTVQIHSSDALYGDDNLALGETSPSLASLPGGAVLPPVRTAASEHDVTVLIDVSNSMTGELYLTDDLRRPGILILAENIAAWGSIPQRFSRAGYVVLILQIKSATQADQIETMLRSLIAIPSVDAGVIGVIGDGRAADLAALGCAVNSLCDALALLSPLARGTLINMLPSYGDRPLWLAAGRDDAEAFETASALAAAAQGEARLLNVDSGRGAVMTQLQPEVVVDLLAWLQRHLSVE